MIGSRLGVYAITAKIGAGGMGEVYRATDTRLMRDVAIKILPAAFLEDRERLARFEREAQLLAQLHHPNISSVFGLEEADGVRALVMELVEGPTLLERLAAGPIPLEETLSIARQIAEALEEAHEKGIIHRDLKPANVKLTLDGRVKVLDFGLAKALDPVSPRSSSGSQLSQSPTLVNSATIMGTILGTAAYMAPEQAAGGAADRRADIWSFGVVLYEMLTGKRLFEGETVSHVLAGVLKDAPDFSALPGGTPERIVNLLRRCLRKKPRERLQAIGDARIVIEEVQADPRRDKPLAAAAAPSAGPLRAASKAPWIAAAAGLASAVLFAGLWIAARRVESPSRALHLSLVAPQGMAFGDTFALSPDGRRIVFEAYDHVTGARALWLRALDRGDSVRLAQSDGGEMPFWSPDGRHIAFFADGRLRRIDTDGGTPQVLSDAPTPRGGAWGPDGRIIFSPSFRSGLSVVSSSGGEAKPLTTLDKVRNERSHRFPVFLRDGRTILFLAQTAEGGARNDESTIEALDLSSGKRTRLIQANSSPLYGAGGSFLFWREGALLAERLDESRLTVSGDAERVVSPVAYTQNEQALASVSSDGTLVYHEGARGVYSSLIWVDRKNGGVQVLKDRELYADVALSHDGKRLAYSMNSVGQGSSDIWILDLERNSSSRLTFTEGSDRYPVWSKDDRHIYYSNDSDNDGTVFRRASDGTGNAEEIGTAQSGIWPMDISADGRWMLVGNLGSQTNRDIQRFDLATKTLTPLVTTLTADQTPALSPDGTLLAYASEQSGRFEVYVQALGGGTGQWQISTDSGVRPRWRADGREILYTARPDRIMSVEVEPGVVPRFSAPRLLFRNPLDDFDVSPDGQRILGLRPDDSDLNRPLTLISNWRQLMSR